MKLLWIAPCLLHPTTKGGQIRTLQLLRQLHRRHEVHYVGLGDPAHPEAIQKATEYCTHVYPVKHEQPAKRSLLFGLQFAANIFSDLPLSISRFRSREALRIAAELVEKHNFNSIVCDFLASSPNVPCLEKAVLFQHNFETTLWQRRSEHAPTRLHRLVYRAQAQRMLKYERSVCRKVDRVIAVSRCDAARMQDIFGINRVCDIQTGVDIDHFKRPDWRNAHLADLVFIGSMDWMPNIHAIRHFVRDVWPQIRKRRPSTTLAIVGRQPAASIRALASTSIDVTGTVPDIRPYLWGAKVSIVPLRIGGGTRLKIFEAMAAGVPVVSTGIGAEGLPVSDGRNILLADDAAEFAERCLFLLENQDRARHIAQRALTFVRENASWEAVAQEFEQSLAGIGQAV